MEIKMTRDTMSDIYFDALKIRNQVFVKEQNVPYALEVENPLEEAQAVHFVLYENGKALATVRLLVKSDENLVQRMAVVKSARGLGYAGKILSNLIEFAKQNQIHELTLHAQLSARSLYEKFGFEPFGEIFEEAGIQHISMKKTL